eukprot:scaffold577_cov405-Prasinococcus_capsulatus_cf.AAC.7
MATQRWRPNREWRAAEEPENKPARSIFLKALGMANCEPKEAIHVGDSLSTDIQGAYNADLLASVWVNERGVPLQEGVSSPHFTVRDVLQLPSVIAALEA